MQVFPDLVADDADRSRTSCSGRSRSRPPNRSTISKRWRSGRIWAAARAPFHLYVPAGSVEIARRLASETTSTSPRSGASTRIGDQTRFTLVHRSAPEVKRPSAPSPQAAGRRRATGERPRAAAATRSRPARAARLPPGSARKAARRGSAGRRGRPKPRPTRRPEEEVVLPYLRFSRDKRGYEHTFVIHSDRRRGRSRDPCSLLVPHAAGREGRAIGARRSGDPRHRGRAIRTSSSTGPASSKSRSAEEPPTGPAAGLTPGRRRERADPGAAGHAATGRSRRPRRSGGPVPGRTSPVAGPRRSRLLPEPEVRCGGASASRPEPPSTASTRLRPAPAERSDGP